MLKLTVKAGEYLLVGDNIKVVFTGGSANNMHVLVDVDLCQYVGQKKSKDYAVFLSSSSSFCCGVK